MKHASVTFIFDFPLSIAEYSIFDVGTKKPYIDWDGTISDFKSNLENINVAIDEMHEVCTANYMPISVYFSGVFLKLLQEVNSSALSKIKSAVQSNNLELLGGTYNHSLTSLYSLDQFQKEVEAQSNLIFELFRVRPDRCYNTENIYFNGLTDRLSKLNFKSVFAGVIDWYVGDHKSHRVFHVTKSKKFKVLLIDSDNGHALFNNSVQDVHFFQFDFDKVKELGGVKRIVHMASKKSEISNIASCIEAASDSYTYSIKSPVMGSPNSRSLNQYISLGMQSSIFSLYYSIYKDSLDECQAFLSKYIELGQASNFLLLAPDAEKTEKTSYKLYSQLINILSDLRLKSEEL